MSPALPPTVYCSIVYPPFQGESKWKNGPSKTLPSLSTISQWSVLMTCWPPSSTNPDGTHPVYFPSCVKFITSTVLRYTSSSFLTASPTHAHKCRSWSTRSLSALLNVTGNSRWSFARINLVASSPRPRRTNGWTT